mgnify:CR=1 FL=1
MNKTIKELWIKELESDNYKHGTFKLKQEIGSQTRHCCLGVLCEVHRKLKKKGESVWERHQVEEHDMSAFYHYKNRGSALHEDLLEWAELDSNQQWDLVAINDNSRDYSRQIKFIKEKL